MAVGTLALFLGIPSLRAQHEPAGEAVKSGAEKPGEQKHEEGGGLEIWAWLNFALLAAGLVWLYRKNGVPYFVSRAIGIRRGMIEADDARAEAERKIAAVETRFSRLQSDIQALKDEAIAEQKVAHERARQATLAELAKIQTHAEQEITSAGNAARMELRRYSAQLAVSRAEAELRARVDHPAQDALFRGFIKELGAVSAPQGN
jgi:F-type H+-transporting ATPase subunit b